MAQDPYAHVDEGIQRANDVLWEKIDGMLSSSERANVFIAICIFLAILCTLGLGYYLTRWPTSAGAAPAEVQAPASTHFFTCSDGKIIGAEFSQHSVHLALSDGRELMLPQTVSGSGARYANPDESFVFWNKGNSAFIEESGVQTYSDCVTES